MRLGVDNDDDGGGGDVGRLACKQASKQTFELSVSKFSSFVKKYLAAIGQTGNSNCRKLQKQNNTKPAVDCLQLELCSNLATTKLSHSSRLVQVVAAQICATLVSSGLPLSVAINQNTPRRPTNGKDNGVARVCILLPVCVRDSNTSFEAI